MKDHYTRVLLGNLDISSSKWPASAGLTGADFDVLARRHLWAVGLDFQHGTGHGVGYFLNVHEHPPGIHKYAKDVLLTRMITSNEPGFYQEGEYGIRIEDMIMVEEQVSSETGPKDFLQWRVLTQVPYCRNLIDVSMLGSDRKAWVDRYHAEIYANVQSLVLPETLDWLQRATAPL